MITDKNGKEVRDRDVIEFGNSGIPYQVVTRDGHLGAYENGEFIFLKDVLKNFVITNR